MGGKRRIMSAEKGLGGSIRGILLVAGMIGLLASSQSLQAAMRRVGVKVGVTMGPSPQFFAGEVIGVRADAIVIETEPGETLTLVISDISSLRVYRRSQAVTGGLAGALAGGAIAYAASEAEYGGKLLGELGIIIYTAIGVMGGGVAGAIVGGIASADKTYYLKNMPKASVDRIMAKLRKRARVPKYQ